MNRIRIIKKGRIYYLCSYHEKFARIACQPPTRRTPYPIYEVWHYIGNYFTYYRTLDKAIQITGRQYAIFQ